MSIIDDVQDKNKITFKCKHCDNDDIRYMQFFSLNKQSPQYANHMYRQNWDYETTPKVPIGIHIRCAKCGKDTFIIPDYYQGTMWGMDIPEQCIVNITYEKPPFSSKKYIINGEGKLDVVVYTISNEIFSLISQKLIVDDGNITYIKPEKYHQLVAMGLPTVEAPKMDIPKQEINNGGGKYESTNDNGNVVRERKNSSNVSEMASHESNSKTARNG